MFARVVALAGFVTVALYVMQSTWVHFGLYDVLPMWPGFAVRAVSIALLLVSSVYVYLRSVEPHAARKALILRAGIVVAIAWAVLAGIAFVGGQILPFVALWIAPYEAADWIAPNVIAKWAADLSNWIGMAMLNPLASSALFAICVAATAIIVSYRSTMRSQHA